MTDAEWAECDDPKALLGDLPATLPRRKLLLFAVACCRRLGTAVTGPEMQRLLAASEAHADGEIDAIRYRKEVNLAILSHSRSPSNKGRNHPDRAPLVALGLLVVTFENRFSRIGTGLSGHDLAAVRKALKDLLVQLAHQGKQGGTTSAFDDARAREQRHLAAVLRDVVGPRSASADVAPLARDDRTVAGLLAGVVADAAYDRLPILADALEDAGCADGELLRHLRGPGPHFRGCWAVDVLRNLG